MRYVPDDLQVKIDNGTATADEIAVHRLLSVVDEMTPEEAVQKIVQAEAVCDAREKAGPEHAAVLLELFADGALVARRTVDGFEFRLTDTGLAMGEALVHSMGGCKTS